MEFPDPFTLVTGLLFGGAKLAVWIAVIVFALVRWQRIRPMFKLGVMVGAVLLALRLPAMIASAIYVDPSSLFPGEEVSRSIAETSYRAGLIGAFVMAVIGVFHVALQIGLGEDAFPERSAYPTLLRRPGRFAGWRLGAILGVVVAVASAPLYWLLGAKAGPSFEWLRNLMPGYESVPAAVRYSIAIPAVAGIAVAEEIFFRGVIQRWLVRMGNGRHATVIWAVVATSLFWAVGHAGNVDPAWFKLLQVFGLGLIFGALAHRHGVESACMAHACLNVTAMIVGLAFE